MNFVNISDLCLTDRFPKICRRGQVPKSKSPYQNPCGLLEHDFYRLYAFSDAQYSATALI